MKKFASPIERMDKYLTRKGLITAERTARVRLEAKNTVRDALKNATGELLPEIDNLFSDVYEEIPKHLLEQREELRAHVKKYPDSYELEKFVNGKSFLK
jgi:2-oxoisovalerate dehydrogenase E1 component alpha subunit